MLDILVIGGANTDYFVKAKDLPKAGETVMGDEFRMASGGKGANQAVAAARLGARTAFVGRLGSDPRGSDIVASLAAEGVDVSRTVRCTEAATGVALITVDAAGHKQIATAPGANLNLSARDVLGAEQLLARAKVVLLQLEVPLQAVEVAVRLAKAANARIVLDPAPPHELPDSLLEGIDVVRPNAAEAKAMTGVEVKCRETATLAGKKLLERGVRAAVIGAPEGNMLVTPEIVRWFPELEVEAVDLTGSGDAMAAAIAVELSRGRGIEESVRFASAAAAFASTKPGGMPAMPRRADVERLLSRSVPGAEPRAA